MTSNFLTELNLLRNSLSRMDYFTTKRLNEIHGKMTYGKHIEWGEIYVSVAMLNETHAKKIYDLAILYGVDESKLKEDIEKYETPYWSGIIGGYTNQFKRKY